MTKEQLLDDIRRRFHYALHTNKPYEDITLSLQFVQGKLFMRVSGARDGYNAFTTTEPIELEPQDNPKPAN